MVILRKMEVRKKKEVSCSNRSQDFLSLFETKKELRKVKLFIKK